MGQVSLASVPEDSSSGVPRELLGESTVKTRPSLRYRLTGFLNQLVWKAPLPHMVCARLSLCVYRSPPMAASQVHIILASLEAAGVEAWVSGGWGIDALAGEQRRVHRDLDLMLDFEDQQRALDALAELGYQEHYRVTSDVPRCSRTVLSDALARVIDLRPVEAASMREHFTEGRVGSAIVPCLTRSFQLADHEGYHLHRHERRDIAMLRRLDT